MISDRSSTTGGRKRIILTQTTLPPDVMQELVIHMQVRLLLPIRFQDDTEIPLAVFASPSANGPLRSLQPFSSSTPRSNVRHDNLGSSESSLSNPGVPMASLGSSSFSVPPIGSPLTDTASLSPAPSNQSSGTIRTTLAATQSALDAFALQVSDQQRAHVSQRVLHVISARNIDHLCHWHGLVVSASLLMMLNENFKEKYLLSLFLL